MRTNPNWCPRCNAWDDDLNFRGGICECCYIEDQQKGIAV
jgi:hypothetical protein